MGKQEDRKQYPKGKKFQLSNQYNRSRTLPPELMHQYGRTLFPDVPPTEENGQINPSTQRSKFTWQIYNVNKPKDKNPDSPPDESSDGSQ